MWIQYIALICGLAYVAAIPIDNGVEGEPEVECGPDAVGINFNTRNDFEGHVYVQGLYNDPGCRNSEGGRKNAGITLGFSTCNVLRTRSLNPRGVFVRVSVVISFHPQFITKVDRAYTIQCFYMEADKTVSQDIEVSMLTTGIPQTAVVPMPVCRYDILDGGPQGAPVKYAIVGQQVYHKWTCDTDTIDTFCMRVHSCFVDDGANDRVDLLSEDGCALDRYLLRNLEYPQDLMAGQETHVFKYADRPQLFFQCQIAIAIKEPGEDCILPVCQDPPRGKRAAVLTNYRPVQDHGTVDVIATLNSLELDDVLEGPTGPGGSTTNLSFNPRAIRNPNDFCLSNIGFGILVAVVVCIFLISTIVIALLCLKRSVKL